MNNVLRKLSEQLINDKGMPNVGMAIWRDKEKTNYTTSIGEFLSLAENLGGYWLIDGGWGGPPGPILVIWDHRDNTWRSLGFQPWEGKAEKLGLKLIVFEVQSV